MKLALPNKPFFLSFLIASLAFTSCKKDGGSTNTVKTDKFTGVTWTSNKIEFQQADNSWKEVNDPDFHWSFVFNTDNTFTVVQMYRQGNSTKTGTWHLINNNTQLTLSGNYYQGTYTITQSSSSVLQWTVVSPGFWGNEGRAVRETFGH